MVWLSIAYAYLIVPHLLRITTDSRNRALIGSPISGAILDRSGYLALTMFSGVAQVLGAAIVCYAKILHNPKFFAIA